MTQFRPCLNCRTRPMNTAVAKVSQRVLNVQQNERRIDRNEYLQRPWLGSDRHDRCLIGVFRLMQVPLQLAVAGLLEPGIRRTHLA